ncbi:MAG: lysophospholipid acyltransferase family protein [Nitrospirota bacterium]
MHPEAKSKFREYQGTPFLKGLIRAFRFASGILPLWFMKTLAISIVPFFIIFNLDNYKAVVANFSRIRPADGIIKRIFAGYKLFLNYSFYLIDLFYLGHDSKRIKNYRIEIDGENHLNKMLSLGQGFILLTLHMGNWEIGGFLLSSKEVTPYIVYSPDSEKTVELHRKMLRESFNVKAVSLDKEKLFSIKLLNILRDGGVIAFQGDRLFGESGVEVEFFGKKALFPRGPLTLAMIADVPILPVFCIIEGYNYYKLYIEKPYIINSYPSREETIKKSLEDLVKIFEKYILQYAEQWYTFMPFWLSERKET